MPEIIVNPGPEPVANPKGTDGGRQPGKSAPLVSIIVACCGQLEYTRLCVPSLVRFSRQPYELFFLDCESLDGTAEYLGGLAAALPARVEIAHVSADPPTGSGRKDEQISIRGDFVAFLNNDTIVTQGWLDSLVSAAQVIPDAGLVAPMSNCASPALLIDPVPYGVDDWGRTPAWTADGERDQGFRLQDALVQIEKVNAFARQWRESNRQQTFDLDTAGGGCALVKREVLQKLGLFPTRTALGVFDLESLGNRVRQAGYRLAGCREAYIHYFGSRGMAGR
jgi:GT2 family glycosyltransferase